MRANQKVSGNRGRQSGDHSNQVSPSQKNSSRNNAFSEDASGDEKMREGTKMPGRETRTPVAVNKPGGKKRQNGKRYGL